MQTVKSECSEDLNNELVRYSDHGHLTDQLKWSEIIKIYVQKSECQTVIWMASIQVISHGTIA